jgi:shikimate kinase
MPLPSKIILIGMPGSGKTTLGLGLSKELSLPFFDLDKIIEDQEKQSIKEVFAAKGEEYFRKVEAAALTNFLSNHASYILSSGGGAPCFFDNMDKMVAGATTVFIDVSEEKLLERLHTTNLSERPLLGGDDLDTKIKNTLTKRRVFYERAHYIIQGENISPFSIISCLEEKA